MSGHQCIHVAFFLGLPFFTEESRFPGDHHTSDGGGPVDWFCAAGTDSLFVSLDLLFAAGDLDAYPRPTAELRVLDWGHVLARLVYFLLVTECRSAGQYRLGTVSRRGLPQGCGCCR